MRAGRGSVVPGKASGVWPVWARRLAGLALAFHLAAIVAGALGSLPSSPLEQRIAAQFSRYFELIDQGYSYRYYAPEPPPTPVIEAVMHYADGHPDRTVRLPDRSARPRLLYQRQLALANSLFVEYAAAREQGERHAHWAPSYARHLGRMHGCTSVTFLLKRHLIPDPARIVTAESEGRPAGIDDAEFYTVPERIGDYACDGS
jgi:hypothetical protein